jgi:hypothetical protein
MVHCAYARRCEHLVLGRLIPLPPHKKGLEVAAELASFDVFVDLAAGGTL